jgi:hypothetical protein
LGRLRRSRRAGAVVGDRAMAADLIVLAILAGLILLTVCED